MARLSARNGWHGPGSSARPRRQPRPATVVSPADGSWAPPPSPSPLSSGEGAGVMGDAVPQRLEPARVLFELGQVILAIDGDDALQQLGRLRDFPFFLPDSREQVVGPGHAQFITQTPADPKPGRAPRARSL